MHQIWFWHPSCYCQRRLHAPLLLHPHQLPGLARLFMSPRTAHWPFDGERPLPASATTPPSSATQPHPTSNRTPAPHPSVSLHLHASSCAAASTLAALQLHPSTPRLLRLHFIPPPAGPNEWPCHPRRPPSANRASEGPPAHHQTQDIHRTQTPAMSALLPPSPARLSCPRTALVPSQRGDPMSKTHNITHSSGASGSAEAPISG